MPIDLELHSAHVNAKAKQKATATVRLSTLRFAHCFTAPHSHIVWLLYTSAPERDGIRNADGAQLEVCQVKCEVDALHTNAHTYAYKNSTHTWVHRQLEALPTYTHTHQREDDALRTNTHTYAYMSPTSTTCTAHTYTHTHQREVDAPPTNVHSSSCLREPSQSRAILTIRMSAKALAPYDWMAQAPDFWIQNVKSRVKLVECTPSWSSAPHFGRVHPTALTHHATICVKWDSVNQPFESVWFPFRINLLNLPELPFESTFALWPVHFDLSTLIFPLWPLSVVFDMCHVYTAIHRNVCVLRV